MFRPDLTSAPRCAVALLVALLRVPSVWSQGIVIVTVPPARIGLDSAGLDQAATVAESVPALTSLLVWRRGALGYEGYFHGGARDVAVNVKSVSKSFLSAIVGIAMAEGKLTDLDRPVAAMLPEYYQPVTGTLFTAARARSDSLRRKVTLRHLLTMSSGLGWDETNAFLTYGLLLSGNPVRFAAELPVLAVPGAAFNYATASSHLVAGVLARVLGTTNQDFAQRYLFGPTGIVLTRWDADPSGVNFGGSEMYFTTREMLKLGILYLRQGRVGDRQVVPAEWVTESVRKHYDVTAPAYRQMVPGLAGYGYFWWLRSAGGQDMICALGLGGQFVLVVPVLELVIAGTSALDGRNPGNEKQFTAIFDLVDRHVVASAR